MKDKIKLGISRCLLGEKVRYDGQHKLDRYLRDTLGQYFDWVPVCPESECGLPTPREAMRLVGNRQRPRLVTTRTRLDHTDRMLDWGRERLEQLEGEELCGYVFKSKSPSCGVFNVKVFNEDGVPSPVGMGLWARMLAARFPLVPIEEESRLLDPQHRETFIEGVYATKRLPGLP